MESFKEAVNTPAGGEETAAGGRAYGSFENVAYDALTVNLPRFAFIVSAGLCSLFVVYAFWSTGDVHLVDDTVRISTIAVGLIIALGVAGYSYSSKELARKHLFLLTSLLAASSYLALGQFVYAEPHSTWVVAIVSISVVASGAIYFSKKYLTVQIFLGLASLYVPLVVLTFMGKGTVELWRMYTLTSFFTAILSYAVHKYVYTYTTGIAVVTEKALESSEHDAMTGLLNREGLEKIYSMLSYEADTKLFASPKNVLALEALRAETHFSVLFLDMDNLKGINDAFGHEKGDEAIRLVAEALRRNTRVGEDLCARWGGDEFVVVSPLKNIDSELLQSRINEWLERNVPNDAEYTVAVTVGEPELSRPDRTLQDALRDADREMYRRKPAKN